MHNEMAVWQWMKLELLFQERIMRGEVQALALLVLRRRRNRKEHKANMGAES